MDENIKKQEGMKVAKVEYSSTRNKTGKFNEVEKISKNEIDFASCEGHLNIHAEGEVAGSQFSGEVFKDPKEIIEFIKNILPDEVPFDEFGRSEITMECTDTIGWTGIMSLEDLEKEYGGEVQAEQKSRMPGGETGEFDGKVGTWYPEGRYNPEAGKFEILKNEDGSIKNPHGKFEPLANIAEVGHLPETKKITAILEKDQKTGKPVMRTAFPGDNAPMFPSNFGESMKDDAQETMYWSKNAFLKLNEYLANQEKAIEETGEAQRIEADIENVK